MKFFTELPFPWWDERRKIRGRWLRWALALKQMTNNDAALEEGKGGDKLDSLDAPGAEKDNATADSGENGIRYRY